MVTPRNPRVRRAETTSGGQTGRRSYLMPSSKSEAVTPRAFARSPSRSYRSPRRPNSTSMMMFLETPDLNESCSCVNPRSMRNSTMRAPTARRRFSQTFTRLGSSWLGRVGTSLSYQARQNLTARRPTPDCYSMPSRSSEAVTPSAFAISIKHSKVTPRLPLSTAFMTPAKSPTRWASSSRLSPRASRRRVMRDPT